MLLCLYFLNTRRVILSGVLYGLAVHMKLYPVIHCLAFYLAVDRTPWRWVRNGVEISNVDKTPRKRSGKRSNIKVTPREENLRRDKISNMRKTPCLRTDAQVRKLGENDSLWARAWDRIGEISIDWGSMFSYKRVQFVLASSGTFFSLGLIFYMMYGWEFIEETYLYHVKRTDTKHNFSLYFYMLFMTQTWLASLLSKVAFVPQFVLLSLSSLLLYKDVAFCLFVQTFVFVAFNKVVTSQYFLWYLCYLPLIVPHSSLTPTDGVVMTIMWLLAQGSWLLPAYLLEYKGYDTYLFIWLGSCVFFIVNVYIIIKIINNHKRISKKDKSL